MSEALRSLEGAWATQQREDAAKPIMVGQGQVALQDATRVEAYNPAGYYKLQFGPPGRGEPAPLTLDAAKDVVGRNHNSNFGSTEIHGIGTVV